jgi:hypothetical protein
MEVLELTIVGAVIFVGSAISRTRLHRGRIDRAMLGYWLHTYALMFLGVYLVLRLYSPGELAGDTVPNDGRVWRLVTVAWGAMVLGGLCGRWVRSLRSQRDQRMEPRN